MIIWCVFDVQLRLTAQYLELKRYESIGKMAKVYYGPNIPNFMIELPQSLTTAAATNANESNSNTPEGAGSKIEKEPLPPVSDTQKT